MDTQHTLQTAQTRCSVGPSREVGCSWTCSWELKGVTAWYCLVVSHCAHANTRGRERSGRHFKWGRENLEWTKTEALQSLEIRMPSCGRWDGLVGNSGARASDATAPASIAKMNAITYNHLSRSFCSVYCFSRSCPKTVSRTREVFPTDSSTLLRLQLSRTRDCTHRSRHVGLLLFLFFSFGEKGACPK